MTDFSVCASRSTGKELDTESGLDYFGASLLSWPKDCCGATKGNISSLPRRLRDDVLRGNSFLSLRIPFDQLPYILDTITLERRNCVAGSTGCDNIVLPELRNRLLPGPVVLSDLKQGDYRLQGDHLKTVSKVRLVRDGKATDYDASVGLNNVDFSAPNLKPGSYNVYLLLGNLSTPATFEDQQKKLKQTGARNYQQPRR